MGLVRAKDLFWPRQLKPFQKAFLAAVEDERYDTIALSGPRGLGKTFIAAKLLTRALTPGDSLFSPGREVVLGAATLETARLCYGFIREWLEDTGQYRWVDSANRISITHIATNSRLRVISPATRKAVLVWLANQFGGN